MAKELELSQVEEAARLLCSVTGGNGDSAAPSLAHLSRRPGPFRISDECIIYGAPNGTKGAAESPFIPVTD